LLPSSKSAQQGLNVTIAQVDKLLCHTGTLLFLASGAVQYDLVANRELAQTCSDLLLWYRYGAHDVLVIVRILAADIHQYDLSSFQLVPSFVYGDAGHLGVGDIRWLILQGKEDTNDHGEDDHGYADRDENGPSLFPALAAAGCGSLPRFRFFAHTQVPFLACCRPGPSTKGMAIASGPINKTAFRHPERRFAAVIRSG
jgi:hypothetical protein